MEYKKLQKVWYINAEKQLKFPAIIQNIGTEIKPPLPSGVYEVWVYFGGVWETLIATVRDIQPRQESMSEAMFEFRQRTMQIENIQYDYST